jgi:tetratricopeptide (TPR) repeat protein
MGIHCDNGISKTSPSGNASFERDKVPSFLIVATFPPFSCCLLQDVIMYNLVTDAEFKYWRVLFSYLSEALQGGSESAGTSHDAGDCPDFLPAPQFDSHQHHQLMADLKTLYVAITRSMVRLVWYEKDWDRMAPFQMMFSRLGLVNEVPLSLDSVALLHRSSSPSEWRKRGQMLFEHQQYDQAWRCYTRSGDKLLAAWALACSTQQRAQEARVRTSGDSQRLYVEAAHLFEAAQKLPQAAECYDAALDHLQAGRVHMNLENWESAAKCFEKGGGWLKAQEAHERRADNAGKRTDKGVACMERSLACLLHSGDPELLQKAHGIMTALFQSCREDGAVSKRIGALKETVVYNIVLEHHRAGRTEQMMEVLVQLSSTSRQKRFLSTRGYHAELITVRLHHPLLPRLLITKAEQLLILSLCVQFTSGPYVRVIYVL